MTRTADGPPGGPRGERAESPRRHDRPKRGGGGLRTPFGWPLRPAANVFGRWMGASYSAATETPGADRGLTGGAGPARTIACGSSCPPTKRLKKAPGEAFQPLCRRTGRAAGDCARRTCASGEAAVGSGGFGGGGIRRSHPTAEDVRSRPERPAEGGSEPAATPFWAIMPMSVFSAFTAGSTTKPIAPCGSCRCPETPNARRCGSTEGMRKLPASQSQIARLAPRLQLKCAGSTEWCTDGAPGS